MESVLPNAIRAVVAAAGSPSSEVQRTMEAHAEETGFPVVGPEVGGLLRLLTRAVGARRVFEFGSGFGYSASWFAEALPADGRVVLTEFDAEEVAMAQGFLAEAGVADRVTFERGDAFETLERYDGPFDVVFLDCEKYRYPEAIEPVREKLAPGGLLVADNVLAAGYDPGDVAAGFRREPSGEHAGSVAGVVKYLAQLRSDPAFETTVVPLGEGLAVSHYAGAE